MTASTSEIMSRLVRHPNGRSKGSVLKGLAHKASDQLEHACASSELVRKDLQCEVKTPITVISGQQCHPRLLPHDSGVRSYTWVVPRSSRTPLKVVAELVEHLAAWLQRYALLRCIVLWRKCDSGRFGDPFHLTTWHPPPPGIYARRVNRSGNSTNCHPFI